MGLQKCMPPELVGEHKLSRILHNALLPYQLHVKLLVSAATEHPVLRPSITPCTSYLIPTCKPRQASHLQLAGSTEAGALGELLDDNLVHLIVGVANDGRAPGAHIVDVPERTNNLSR